jgi:DNA-binding transcriptional regulator YiaG
MEQAERAGVQVDAVLPGMRRSNGVIHPHKKTSSMTGADVYNLRRKLDITQVQLRDLLNYKDVMTISRWERGVKTVPERAAVKMRALVKK